MTGNSEANQIASLRLRVIHGPDKGKTFSLNTDREYLMGRSEECDIRLDPSDKTVSRRHVRLKTGSSNIVIENLSSTNPVQIRGKPVSKITIGHGQKFHVGNTLYTLEVPGKIKTSGGTSKKRIIILSGLLVFCVFIVFIGLSGKKEQPEDRTPLTRPADVDETRPPVVYESLESLPAAGEIEVSQENQLRSDQHFRQGMFFYDTGNIFRAVNEWEKALGFNPNHSDARIWFLKAEKELEDIIRDHYQSGLLHYKYMRYNQAAHEFRMVMELSRNKSSDQYLNAQRYINELKGR